MNANMKRLLKFCNLLSFHHLSTAQMAENIKLRRVERTIEEQIEYVI